MVRAMVPAPDALPLDRNFDAEPGTPVDVAPGIVRVTAPNTGPYTFTGTNSFLIGDSRLLVLDPGPRDRGHFDALLRAIGGRKVEAVLLTHTHLDHSGLGRRLAKAVRAPLRFAHGHRLYRQASWLEKLTLSRSCDFGLLPDERIGEGERLSADGITLSAIGTPGHCENHLAFGVAGTPYLFSGDHVMGWSSTVIAPPDGAMRPYLDSLQKVITLSHTHYLPAHGGPIADGRGFAEALLAHRLYRNEQILDGLAAGYDMVGRLLRRIYPDLPLNLQPAARKTIEAHLDYLMQSRLVEQLPGARYRVL